MGDKWVGDKWLTSGWVGDKWLTSGCTGASAAMLRDYLVKNTHGGTHVFGCTYILYAI